MGWNLNKYLQRINHAGGVAPTIQTLNTLQKNHLLNIPFENLDIHYGRKINLDIVPIFEKIVNNGRGGFCYELNGLFHTLLRAIGFDIKMISARAFNSQQQIFGQEYDHLALIVSIGTTEYLADVGFGEFSFLPLKMALNEIQHDQRAAFKIERYDDRYLKVSKQAGENWLPEYIFSSIPRTFNEFQEMCNYHQTSPHSHFTQNKLCSIATENGRITLTGDKLKVTDGSTAYEQRLLNDEEFTSNLAKYFNIKID
jgi:N-hydroxyarylamine O-acetyltransferase